MANNAAASAAGRAAGLQGLTAAITNPAMAAIRAGTVDRGGLGLGNLGQGVPGQQNLNLQGYPLTAAQGAYATNQAAANQLGAMKARALGVTGNLQLTQAQARLANPMGPNMLQSGLNAGNSTTGQDLLTLLSRQKQQQVRYRV